MNNSNIKIQNPKISPGIKEYVRALRFPFVTASIFPFVAGSLISKPAFKLPLFLLGLISAIATHLGANLINDYADSKSGADWLDKKFYKFFGGSKLIQEGVIKESSYLKMAVFCFTLAFVCVGLLAIFFKSALILGFYLLILFLGFSYSHKPFQFSYHCLGETVIFILFGPALVTGAHFIQTGIFPAFESFMLSLPFGFFATAILFANEVPDFSEDRQAGKFTWVSLTGKAKAFGLYCLLVSFGFIVILLNIVWGNLGLLSLFSFICIIPAVKAAKILRNFTDDKIKLMESSKLTIMIHTFVSLVLLLDIFF